MILCWYISFSVAITTGWSVQNGIYTSKKFDFEVQDYCLFWKQRKQFCTSLNSEDIKAHTQKYGNMKSDEQVTLRKMCNFKCSDWVVINTSFLLQWFKKITLLDYHFNSLREVNISREELPDGKIYGSIQFFSILTQTCVLLHWHGLLLKQFR